MNKYHAIVVVFFVGVTVLTWLRTKNTSNTRELADLQRAFPWFITFVAVGATLVVGFMMTVDRYGIQEKISGFSIIFIVVLGVSAYFVVRRIENKLSGKLERQFRSFVLVFILSLALYGIVLMRMDPVVLTLLSIIAAVGFIVLIEWSRWKK